MDPVSSRSREGGLGYTTGRGEGGAGHVKGKGAGRYGAYGVMGRWVLLG